MRKGNRDRFARLAIEAYPNEACALLVAVNKREVLIPCRNTADDPRKRFTIAAEDYAAAEERGAVVGVVHSHVDASPQPSAADRAECNGGGVPWHILAVHGGDWGRRRVGDWVELHPSGFAAPLVGRTFIHGSHDCYGLIRDCFERERGILLPDFPREDDWWEKPGAEELYLDNFEQAGFRAVRDDILRPFDVILMQYRSNKTNHGGVFLGETPLVSQPGLHPVPGAMLHHPGKRLSERVPYGGYWADITRLIVRHADA